MTDTQDIDITTTEELEETVDADLLRASILYFLEEAIGYRHTLHWLRRYFEEGSLDDLRQLVIQIGRENFVDFKRLMQAAEGNDEACWDMIELLFRQGIKIPMDWLDAESVKDFNTQKSTTPVDPAILTAMRYGSNNNLQHAVGNNWALYNWIDENQKSNAGLNALALLNYSVETVFEIRNDFNKLFDFVALLLGKDTTVLDTVVNDDLNLFSKAVSTYFAGKEWAVKNLTMAVLTAPDLNWKDALSRNQIKSKKWLLEKLQQQTNWFAKSSAFSKEKTVIVVGGWVGILPFLSSLEKSEFSSVINVDIDQTVHPAATILNGQNFRSYRNLDKDIRSIDFSKFESPVIIDTIVEHFENHSDWLRSLPSGTQVVLQGNDMFDVPDHVNCHKNLDEFVDSCGLSKIQWQGELTLPGCTRYMVIGTT